MSEIQYQIDYAKTIKVVESVDSNSQINAAVKYVDLFCEKHDIIKLCFEDNRICRTHDFIAQRLHNKNPL